MRRTRLHPIRLSVAVVLLLCVGSGLACQPLTEPYPPERSTPLDAGVTVSVTDRSTSRWLEGAYVEVVEGPNAGRRCRTRRDGSCFLGDLRSGWHTVEIRAYRYVSATERRSTDDPAWTFELTLEN